MNRKSMILACAGLSLALASADSAWAQPSQSDRLAEQWRAAKRSELEAARAKIDSQLAALDAQALPDAVVFEAPLEPVRSLIANYAPASFQQMPATSRTLASEPRALPLSLRIDQDAPLAPAVAAKDQASLTTTQAREVAKAVAEEEERRATEKFGGVEFGVGISFTGDLGKRDRITSASLDPNGVVRVSDQDNSRARIMLESHYFFTPFTSFLGLRNERGDSTQGTSDKKRWGIGPFLALQPGSDKIIEAIAGGLMIGFRRDDKTTESFNIGLGFVVDPNTKVLGDGILPNQKLPAGESEIRYKETSQSGWLALVSFSF